MVGPWAATIPEFIKLLAEQSVFGRICTPEDIGMVIVSLLSDDFGWVTAQDIEVWGTCCKALPEYMCSTIQW